MMDRRLTMNSLFHDDEEAKKKREQIYVPLALVERKKPDKRQENEEYSPDRGSELYEPEYEEKQRFDHSAFLQQILQQGQGKTQGQRIALIGEPGAGKTTLLQKIADWIEEQKFGLPLWVSLADLTTEGSLQDFDTYLLGPWLRKAVSEDGARQDFQRQFEERRVWLLLDGVDEVATSGVETLGSIAKQLVGWVGKARVVLTCRLNVWQADRNALSDFETFRLLDFDYPQQVHRFIDNWFADKDKGKRLQAELDKAQRSRIQDLVKNPLRLALLCHTWLLHEGDLPETQAGLYAQFVDRFYDWKSHRFPISKQRQRELNRALGELALADIDSGGGRFRLREDFVCEKLGDGDDESSLCHVALQLGWLNQVGVAAESPDKKVYAFYHATFEEYFAALAVSDWRYFLNHLPENVAGGNYRVFESQWKQVILLWLGRKDVDEARKNEFIGALVDNEFIGALVDFEDGTGRDFYGFRTLFLAAAGIAEFKECSRADEIVGQVVKVGFVFLIDEKQESGWYHVDEPTKFLGWYDEIGWAAMVALGETECGRAVAVAALVELIRTSQRDYERDYDFTRDQATYILGEIGQGNDTAIATLVELIRTEEFIHMAVESLGKIGQGNDTAIAALVELIRTYQYDGIPWLAAYSLGKIGQGKDTAIAALVELIGTSQSDSTRKQAAESLEKIGQGNDTAIAALVELIGNSQSEDIREQAVSSLGEIGQGKDTAIATLVELILNSQSDSTRWLPAYRLKKIGQGNDTAIAALVELIRNSQSDYTGRQAAYILGEIGQGKDTAIAALVELISNSQSEDIRKQAVSSLGEIGQGNEMAIAALVELIGTSQSEITLRQAVDSLEEIGRGNDTAIAALVELIRTSQSENILKQAAESLGEIGKGNDTAIAALVELIGTSQSEITLRQAVDSLEEIGRGNDTAIATLVELIGRAAESLGKIGEGKDTAIAALVKLIRTSQSEDTLRQAVKSLGIIGRGNDKAIAALMESIGNFQSKYTLRWAVDSLGEIVREPQMPKLVSALKDYLSDETYKNDRRLFNECYNIIGKCAQTLPYPIFHQAWHNLPASPTATQTREQQLTNIRTQLQHLPLLCIDAEILETETTETAIAQTLCELISTTALPEEDYPEVNNAPQLRKHLRSIAQQKGRSGLVILMQNCEPQPEIQQFCRKIANIAHIAWITETPLEPPLRGFAPSQEDLAGAIASWLQELGHG